jgi:hypothetical protein
MLLFDEELKNDIFGLLILLFGEELRSSIFKLLVLLLGEEFTNNIFESLSFKEELGNGELIFELASPDILQKKKFVKYIFIYIYI